jgi:hypothetical protein
MSAEELVAIIIVLLVLAGGQLPPCPCTRGEPCPGRLKRQGVLGDAPKIKGRIVPPQGGSGTGAVRPNEFAEINAVLRQIQESSPRKTRE